MSDRNFDIIIIGATGFTGQRAVKYLSKHANKNIRWGAAARNPEKLNRLISAENINKEHSFIVDTTQRDQVEAVVEQARIIITTVGPFSLYGEEVIAACARLGTHYLDITGEVGFIKQMKLKYSDLAQKSGAILIPFSGFDSIPAELAALLLSRQFQDPDQLDIRAHYTISGGFNGGTIATMLNKFETGEFKKMSDPRLLMDENVQETHSPKKGQFLGYDKNISRWSVPFIMSGINSKVVYKTSEWMRVHSYPYAKSIAYSEHMNLGRWYNPLPFLGISIFLIMLQLLGPKKWFRSLVKKVAPQPGEGPSEEQIEHGFFNMQAIAKDHKGAERTVTISYPGDPGNKSTIFFLCESALLLSSKNYTKTGFLTPASAFEEDLVTHLESKGLNIQRSWS